MKKNRILLLGVITSALWAGVVFTEPAPVVDLSSGEPGPASAVSEPTPMEASVPASQAPTTSVVASTVNTSSMSTNERIARLEQQINNLTQMNFPSRSDQLQQSIQQLSGQLEVLSHDMQQLKNQQQTFYQDVDRRIAALKSPGQTTAQTTPDETKTAAAVTDKKPATDTVVQNKEEKLYQDAFTNLVNKQNAKAITGFKSYLTQYPKGKYVANTHYWLGELYMMNQQFDEAETQFKTVVSDFASSPKLPDAKLKLALIHDQQGKRSQAKQELQAVVKQYPGSSAAKLADLRLQQMKTPA